MCLLIPDTQLTADSPLGHLVALGKEILVRKPDIIVQIGDWADLASLNSHESPGSKYFHGKTLKADLDAARAGMEALLGPMMEYNKRQARNHKPQYKPRMVLTTGNHSFRLSRLVNENPKLEGLLGEHLLDYESWGWEVYPFLEPVVIEGVAFSHYFVNPYGLTGRPLGGSIDNKIKALGHSFVMGHQQGMQYGIGYNAVGKAIHGLVAGSFYGHDESYMGPQKNRQHWRGFVWLNNLHDGEYDAEFVSIGTLLKDS